MFPRSRATLLPWRAPEHAFARLARLPGVCWLDSSLQPSPDGRFSILATTPGAVFEARDDRWTVRSEQTSVQGTGALDALERWLQEQRREPAPEAPHLPFCGGAIGWLSYDLGRQVETLPNIANDDLAVPDIHLAWYDAALVWDHAAHELWAVGAATPHAANCIASWRDQLDGPAAVSATPANAHTRGHWNLSHSEYVDRVGRVREGIAAGEFYQLNLVQRFTATIDQDPAGLYLRLRERNPAPFAAYLDTGRVRVLSASPERFLEVTSAGRVRTCPIKGTRPRGSDPVEDLQRRAELLASEKERAELLMIVDLLRNDLGRVCRPGSVQVNRLAAVESFATVHHLVGEVEGQLRPDVTRADLLRAVFPGGSITGAPKVSAMRAIERLEPHRRGIAMGSLGTFSADGRIDLSIAIRTIVLHGATAQVSVGAGIVWDSEPDAEYRETLLKAKASLDVLGVDCSSP